MKIITVANLKGGSAKTTSSAYLAHDFTSRGNKVLLVDSDPQGSALRWSEAGDWAIPTIAMPVKNLHTKLRAVVPSDTDVVVIDTPRLDEQAGIVYSAMRAADIALVTMAPAMVEFERLADVWAALEEVESLRNRIAHHEHVVWGVPIAGAKDSSGNSLRLELGDAHSNVFKLAGYLDNDLESWLRANSIFRERIKECPISDYELLL